MLTDISLNSGERERTLAPNYPRRQSEIRAQTHVGIIQRTTLKECDETATKTTCTFNEKHAIKLKPLLPDFTL